MKPKAKLPRSGKAKTLVFRDRNGDTRILSGHLTLKQLAKRGITMRICSPKEPLKPGEWRHVP